MIKGFVTVPLLVLLAPLWLVVFMLLLTGIAIDVFLPEDKPNTDWRE